MIYMKPSNSRVSAKKQKIWYYLCNMKNAEAKKHTKLKYSGPKETPDKTALLRDWAKMEKAAEYLRKTSKPDTNWYKLLGRTNESNS